MLFFSDFTFTQVRIKEKISISRNPKITMQSINNLIPSNLWIAETTGAYFGQIFLAEKHSLTLDTLKIKISDTVLFINTSNYTPNRWSETYWYRDRCKGWEEYFYSTYYTNATGTGIGFNIPNVQEGDTLEFYYKGYNNYPSHSLGADHTVKFALRDPMSGVCYIYYEGAFQDLGYCGITLTLADTVLKFSQPVSDSICPTIPNYNDNLSRRNWIDLELKVTFGNSLMRNVWVKVDAPVIVDSGGHSHNGNRPMGKYGLPKPPPDTGFYSPVSSFTKKTDSIGTIKFRFVASEFGGIEKITAKLLSDTTNFDTINIKVKVDSLQQLPPGDKYVLIGAPDDFDPCNTSTSKHYDNHYGTQRLIEAIQKIAATYDSLHPGIRLRINDMSLKFGGRFDWKNNWSGSHKEHRKGINADIGIRGLNIQNQCVNIVKRDIRDIIFELTEISPLYEPSPPHYHIFVKEQ